MTAAKKIKTPVMVLPPLAHSRDPAADMRVLATRLRRLSLGDVLAGSDVIRAHYAFKDLKGVSIKEI